jgi:hypothetical protein
MSLLFDMILNDDDDDDEGGQIPFHTKHLLNESIRLIDHKVLFSFISDHHTTLLEFIYYP